MAENRVYEVVFIVDTDVADEDLTRLTDTLMAGNRRGYAALADSDKLRDHAKAIKESSADYRQLFGKVREKLARDRGFIL